MKVTEQYFPVVLFIMLFKVVLTFESVDEILKWNLNEVNEQYFPLFKVVLTFESAPAHEILKCGHSHESFWTVNFSIAIFCKMILSIYQVLSMRANDITLEGLICHWYQKWAHLPITKGAFPGNGHLFKDKYPNLVPNSVGKSPGNEVDKYPLFVATHELWKPVFGCKTACFH